MSEDLRKLQEVQHAALSAMIDRLRQLYNMTDEQANSLLVTVITKHGETLRTVSNAMLQEAKSVA